MSDNTVGSITFGTLPPKRPDPIEFVRAAERAQAEFEARDEYVRRLETDNAALRTRISALETELASVRNLYAAQEERYERGRKDEDAARERIAAFEAQVAKLTAERDEAMRLNDLSPRLNSAKRRIAESYGYMRRLPQKVRSNSMVQTAPRPLQDNREAHGNQQLPSVEPPLHTQEVTGSSPVAPTTSQQLTGDDCALTSCPTQGRRSETAPEPLHAGGAR